MRNSPKGAPYPLTIDEIEDDETKKPNPVKESGSFGERFVSSW